MALSLVNNVSSLIAQENLNNSTNALDTSLQRLSSGLKINSAADGPAALVISQEHQAQISGLQAAINNTANATNVAQTAEGALGEVNTLLLQIRSLAVDSANVGANDPTSVAANQAQINNALQTINQIASSTRFGSRTLLDGSNSGTAAELQAGGTAPVSSLSTTSQTQTDNYTVAITAAATQSTATGSTTVTGSGKSVLAAGETETLTINGVNIQLNGGAGGLSATNAISQINSYTNETGVTAGLDTTGKLLQLTSVAYGSASSFTVTSTGAVDSKGVAQTDGTGLSGATVTTGLDVAGTITDNTSSSNVIDTVGVGNTLVGSNGLSLTFGSTAAAGNSATVQVSNNALQFQIGANAGDTASLSIAGASANDLGQGVSTKFANLNQINVLNSANTSDVLAVVDKAISDVSSQRGQLGAFQTNTLEATANNLQTELTNTTAAESTITDTNFAQETANYTKNQVLVQAGTTVLKNANATAGLVLTLLQ